MSALDNRAAVVYRMYDANYQPLYIGYSTSLFSRIQGHQYESPWFKHVDTISVEHFATRDEARAAEKVAIAAELPKYNVNHRPGAPRGRWHALAYDMCVSRHGEGHLEVRCALKAGHAGDHSAYNGFRTWTMAEGR